MAGSRKKGGGEDFGELQARMTRAILMELRNDAEGLLAGLEDSRRFRILAIVDDFTRESLAVKASETKSSDQRSWEPFGSAIGARMPSGRISSSVKDSLSATACSPLADVT